MCKPKYELLSLSANDTQLPPAVVKIIGFLNLAVVGLDYSTPLSASPDCR